jgi:MarR family transcriptional regulator, organic hydroperoxide resistance regulator
MTLLPATWGCAINRVGALIGEARRNAVGEKSLPAKRVSSARTTKPPDRRKGGDADLPFSESVGYQIRSTHRALQRFLRQKIEPHGITLGMWYFLRVLWSEDGLTQRELSRRVGTMEPTTLSAILNMEERGLVRRVRSQSDRRKQHVYLTPKAQSLKNDLLPLAREVVDTAVQGLSAGEVKHLLRALMEIQRSLDAAAPEDGLADSAISID